MTASRRLLGSWRGLTLLETAAVMLIVAILTVPLVAVASRLIVLPAEWQENLGAVRDARESLHLVASDARQSACYTEGDSEGEYGTFTWTDYSETVARKFSVRYFSNTRHPDGSLSLVREETVDASPARATQVGSVWEFSIRQEGRLIRRVGEDTVLGRGGLGRTSIGDLRADASGGSGPCGLLEVLVPRVYDAVN